LPIGPQLPF